MERHKIKEFLSFVGNLSSNDKIAILHDSDADGVSAAVITAKSIYRITGKKPVLVFTQTKRMVSIEQNTISILKKNKINKLFVLDLAVDQNKKTVGQVEKFSEIIVIDHHKIYSDISSKKTTFIKASMLSKKIEPSRYATAKMCFDLFSKIVDLSDVAWVACVGLVGDFSVNAWKSFVGNTLLQQKVSLSQIKNCTDLVNSVEIIHVEDLSELFEKYYDSENPKTLLASKFRTYKTKVEKELSRLLKKFKQKAEFFPSIDLTYFEFKSKYSIKSYLVNHLSSIAPKHRSIVVVEDVGNGLLAISARRQDFKIKMNDLLERSVKNLPQAIAGGHVPAAGGKIRKEDLPRFKQNLIKNLSDLTR